MRWKQYFKLLYLINNNVYLLLIIQNNAITLGQKESTESQIGNWITMEIMCLYNLYMN